jgi:hypothetical protein
MEEPNWKIKNEDIPMAQLSVAKEIYAISLVNAEMIKEILIKVTGDSNEAVHAHYEKRYNHHMEIINDYIKAEFGHLDTSSLFKNPGEET